MILVPQSHTDHVLPIVLGYVLGRFDPPEGKIWVETLELPEWLPAVPCRLYGPVMDDPPVPESEAVYGHRQGRDTLTRFVNRPGRLTRKITFVSGPFDGSPCVLFTLYGGPAAPREPDDPAIQSEAERAESVAFWKNHALSS